MKRLRVILLFLLLGAIVNVAVAWGISVSVDINRGKTERFTYLAAEPPPSFYDSFTLNIMACDVYLRRGFGSRDIYSKKEFRYEENALVIADNENDDIIPTWAHDSIDIYYASTHHSIGRGWPMIALVSDRKEMPRARIIFITPMVRQLPIGDTGIQLSRWPWTNGEPRVLPLRPVWRGIVINTVFYSVLLRLLLPFPFLLRRAIRRRLDLCVKCAYDLRGLDHQACPECGEEIQKANPA